MFEKIKAKATEIFRWCKDKGNETSEDYFEFYWKHPFMGAFIFTCTLIYLLICGIAIVTKKKWYLLKEEDVL